MTDERQGTIAMGIGLGLLGVSAGAICGMTVTAGASQALLTSTFTFVGGAVLSFSAFSVQAVKNKTKGEVTPPPNIIRVGVGVGLLSLGLLAGAVAGMWFRYTDPMKLGPTPIIEPMCEAPKPSPAAAPVAKPLSFGLQVGAGGEQTLWRVQAKHQDKKYDEATDRDIVELLGLLERCEKSK